MTDMSEKTPNIIMVITHDTGQHVGCYGAGLSTPNIDRLARTGVRFDNYLCTASQCSPSRGSIMTGKYPHRNGLVGLAHIGWELNAGERTLPMVLGATGCETYLFGVQHETIHPETLGYTRLFERVGADPAGRFLARAADATDAFLARLPEMAHDKKPFFASVGFVETHRPFNEPGYDNDSPGDVTPIPWLPDRPGIREDIAGLNGLCYEVDRCMGRIVEGLDAAGIRENTLVVFTTDHGTAMPRAKGTCYDPGVKTALIVNMPGTVRPSARTELLSNVDLLPTLCEVARTPAPDGIDGRTFLPLLQGRPYAPRDHVFLEMTWHDQYNPMRAIRTSRWKYIRNFGDRPLVYLPLDVYLGRAGEEVRSEYYASRRPEEELYDLDSDPLEKTNLADDPTQGGVLGELRDRVSDWMQSTGDRLLAGDWPAPKEQLARLESDAQPN